MIGGSLVDQTAFLIGFSVMSVASLAIYATGKRTHPSGHHTLLHASVPFIAATAYLAMAFGIGTLINSDGSATYLARYVDWSVTTPILLSGLVLLAFHEHGKTGEVGGYLTSVIVLDVLMIVTGLISSLAAPSLAKWIWYGWSCVAFLGVLYLLWGPLRLQAVSRGAALGAAYAKNLIFLTVIWFLYPIVFLVGPEGLKLITDPASVWAFLIMDIIAKVGYAFYAAANLDKALAHQGDERGYRA
nr:bacteriorhodopsin [Sphingomonas sp. CFBP 13728]